MPTPRQYIRQIAGNYVGLLWELRQPGKEKPPTIILCPIEEADYKNYRGKRRPRADEERREYLMKLYTARFDEYITRQQIKRPERKSRSQSVRELMQTWLDEVQSNLSEKTYLRYITSVNYYMEAVGDHAIDDFKKEYRQELLDYLRQKKISPHTQKTHIVQLQRFFRWAEEEEYTDRIIRLRKPGNLTKKKTPIYTLDELRQIEVYLQTLIDTAPNARLKICYVNHMRAFVLIRETAFRAGEVWALQLSRIKLDTGMIQLRDCPEIDWRIKNEEEEDVPISERLKKFLEADLKNRVPGERWYLDDGHGQLYCDSPAVLTKAFVKHWKHLGISGAKPLHGIRATIITLVTEKYGVLAGRDVARHKSIATTDRHYVNIDRRYIGKLKIGEL